MSSLLPIGAVRRAPVLLVIFAAAACAQGIVIPPVDRPEPQATRIGIVPPPGPYAPGVDALHYSVRITLPDSGQFISGRTEAILKIREAKLDTVWLDITGLRVTSVSVRISPQSENRPVSFRQDSARIYFPVRAAVGDTVRVTVVYNGDAAVGDGLIIRKNVHGAWGAFADNWPDRARFWFPVIDHPSDKATVDFSVLAPPAWEVVANGTGRTMVNMTDGPREQRLWWWSIDQPIPSYLMVIGATDFAIGTVDACAPGGIAPAHRNGCVPVTYYAFPPDSAKAARIFRRAGQMVDVYSKLVGPFPYPALAHVQSSTRFGGMENAGAIFYSEGAITREALGEGTVAHETAHQWFGDAVTPGHWSHVWLSEGFATYFGNLFFEKADGLQRFRDETRGSWRGYLQSNVKDLAIVDTTSVPGNDLLNLLNANSYNKGGAVLHMLRGLLGDSAFFAGIRRYYARHEHGTALTADLQRALEEQSGKDLGWFFTQWVYRPGHPILAVSQTWDAAAGEAVVTVEQTQKAAWPTFRFPLDLAFGTDRRTIQISERRQTIRVKLPAAPIDVGVDPDGWLLHELVRR